MLRERAFDVTVMARNVRSQIFDCRCSSTLTPSRGTGLVTLSTKPTSLTLEGSEFCELGDASRGVGVLLDALPGTDTPDPLRPELSPHFHIS